MNTDANNATENKFRAALRPIFTVLAIILALFQLYTTGGFAVFDDTLQKVTHFSLVLAIIFLLVPIKKFQTRKEHTLYVILDVLLSLAALGIGLYYYIYAEEILARIRYVDPLTPLDLIFGCGAVLLALEATRRTAGLPLVIVAGCFLLYGLFGQDMPGPFRHNGVTFERMVEQMFIGTDGIFGLPLAAAASMIFAFIMFGAFLERTGMNTLFIDLSCLLTRKARGGPAKVAIFASALFGSISGSAPANVYGTGIFTIPLMKRVGYSASFAAAVEACASTGGQLMPPIMGAAAFIMADLTGVGYLAVVKAALLPSILFYVSLWLMIHFEAVKKGLGGIPPEEVPPAKEVVKRIYQMIPLVFLIVVLMMGKSVTFAAFSGCLVVAIVAAFNKQTRIGLMELKDIAVASACTTMMITACCACAGIVVGVMGITGGGFKFIALITSYVDGNLMLLLIMLMLTCFIVGMGVPTAPAYIIVSVLAVPAMTKLGVDMLAANLFVLYHAVLSAITPPVCLAAFAGASIAKANNMRTGFEAVKLGLIAFIVPFFFVYEPGLLLQGNAFGILQAAASAFLGLIALAAGMQGYLLKDAPVWQRACLIASGILLINPGLMTDLAGLGLFLLVLCIQFIQNKNQGSSP